MGKTGRPRHPDILTPREWEVLALLRERLTNEEIAQRLGISLDGAKFHVSEILSKLGVATREEAAAWRPERRPWLRKLAWIGLAGAVATALGVFGVVAMSWDGAPGEVEENVPEAQAESGAGVSTRFPPRPTSPPASAHFATALATVSAKPSVPSVTSDAGTYPRPTTPQDVFTPTSTPLATVTPEHGRGDLPFEIFQSGYFSGISTTAEVFKIDTRERWQEFWTAHTSTVSPAPTIPAFDFGERMLIAVITSASMGGDSIQIDRILETTSELQVLATRHTLGDNCLAPAVITQPFQLVSLPLSTRPAKLTFLSQQRPACDPP
jgi:DNA-binding CsgD family transcriptional regulator